MNEIIEKNIENKIYKIRGVQVMLSSDVAQLYNVETKRINETIKRNINRFPSTFCFQLTNGEIDELSSRSQFVTLNRSDNLRGYNIKYLPYVLTEQGIMMLSGLLKSDIAVKVNIEIVDAFVKMRHCITENKDYLPNKVLLLEEKVDNNTKKINEIFDRFIIIDKKILYSCGSSFKDLGKKCFSINRFDDNEYLNKIIETIKI